MKFGKQRQQRRAAIRRAHQLRLLAAQEFNRKRHSRICEDAPQVPAKPKDITAPPNPDSAAAAVASQSKGDVPIATPLANPACVTKLDPPQHPNPPVPAPPAATAALAQRLAAGSPVTEALLREQERQNALSERRRRDRAKILAAAETTRSAAASGFGAVAQGTINVLHAVVKPERKEDPRVKAWTDKTELPLALAAFVFLAAFAIPIIYPHLPQSWRIACFATSNAVWAIFALDYLVKFVIAKYKWQFVRYHLFDLMIVILPFFQPLRLLRLLFLLKVLNRQAGRSLRGQVAAYVTFAGVMVTFVGALAMLDVERNLPHTQITNFGTALWWAVVTITTVGYGDVVPVGVEGRILATIVMLFGITLVGTITATLASWLVERVRAGRDEDNENPEMRGLELLSQKVDQLLLAQATALEVNADYADLDLGTPSDTAAVNTPEVASSVTPEAASAPIPEAASASGSNQETASAQPVSAPAPQPQSLTPPASTPPATATAPAAAASCPTAPATAISPAAASGNTPEQTDLVQLVAQLSGQIGQLQGQVAQLHEQLNIAQQQQRIRERQQAEVVRKVRRRKREIQRTSAQVAAQLKDAGALSVRPAATPKRSGTKPRHRD